ncbi:4022_t:CDS:2, partial [Dentiscutata erythropus]
ARAPGNSIAFIAPFNLDYQDISKSRWYATEASGSTSGLRLSFVLPHQSIYKGVEVQQVNIAATSGDMGILASHVPSIEQLKPGVVEVIENANTTKKFFGETNDYNMYLVSGGFAIINPNSSLDINAVEAFPLEEFSPEAIRTNLAEAQRAVTSGSSEEERNIARVEVEVLESLQTLVEKKEKEKFDLLQRKEREKQNLIRRIEAEKLALARQLIEEKEMEKREIIETKESEKRELIEKLVDTSIP